MEGVEGRECELEDPAFISMVLYQTTKKPVRKWALHTYTYLPCPRSNLKYFPVILGTVLILLILWICVFLTHQTSFYTSLANLGLHTNRNIFTSIDNNV